ncbi:LysR family transcriptional regulator [Aliiglaciecola sp. SL4]|uniref:LysR family transcriptional regulator n=1 Tax=Aliiglaciecola sp. SL4 TaxID=3239806 RepID=UPI00355BB769
MEIRQLRYLVAAIEKGTLSVAADSVFITQPALTRSLKNLEHELGVDLLERLPRGVIPTPAGDLLYRHAHLIINEVKKIKADVPLAAEGVVGNLKIGVGALFAQHIVDDVVWQLATTHDSLSMGITVGFFEGLINKLVEGNLDVVFSSLPSVNVPEELIVEPLSDLHVSFVTNKDHPLAEKDVCDSKDLEAARWVIVDQPHAAAMFTQFFASQGMVTPASLVRTDSLELIHSLLKRGGFVSVLPRHLIHDSSVNDNLVELKVKGPPISRKFGLIYREDIAGRPLLAPFFEGIRRACKEIEEGSY